MKLLIVLSIALGFSSEGQIPGHFAGIGGHITNIYPQQIIHKVIPNGIGANVDAHVGGGHVNAHVGVTDTNAHVNTNLYLDQSSLLEIHHPVDQERILEDEWLHFKSTYGKVYETPEVEKFRREIFFENRAKVFKFNQEYAEGKWNFVQQLNPFADLLNHEFSRFFNGYNATKVASRAGPAYSPSTPSAFIPSANVIFPDSVDWRKVGAVSPVKNQELCAACWAFAAAGALEGHTFRKTGQLVELSAQNLIDCTKNYDNDGCSGGLIETAYDYVKDNQGLDVEQPYPYEATDTPQCRFKREAVGATCTGYVEIPEGDEKSLEIAVATLGPVSVAIDASRDTFQFYSDGIYYDPKCGKTPDDMNHAVLVVGFGQETNGQKYWLVKNSYSTKWGLGGYVKMAKDAGNHCGIATQASYPLV